MSENLFPANLQLSYVISITIPQPTIRIRIPKLLAKAMQRRSNLRSSEDKKGDENGSKEKNKKKKKSGKCKRSLRKKIGAMFSNVFGNKRSSSSSDESSESEDGEEDENGDHDGDEVEKKIDTKEALVKTTRKRIKIDDDDSNSVVQGTAIATGFGVAKSLLVKKKETLETDLAGDEGRVFSKSRRTKKPNNNINKTDDGNDGSTVVGNGNNNGLSIVLAGDRIRSRRLTSKVAESDGGNCSRRKVKVTFMTAWSVKKLMGRESGKNELCRKRILMGGKCRPLGVIQYDENGFLLPEIIP